MSIDPEKLDILRRVLDCATTGNFESIRTDSEFRAMVYRNTMSAWNRNRPVTVALHSVRDWLTHGFPAPVPATVAACRAALDSCDPELAVIVRIWKGEEHNPCIIWPSVPHTNDPYGTVDSWQPIGQHGAADLGIIHTTRRATPDEAAAAIARWRSEAPDRPALRVMSRCPPYHVLIRQRRALLRRDCPSRQTEST